MDVLSAMKKGDNSMQSRLLKRRVPVMIVSVMLVAIIAAIALTLRARKDSKSQNASEQVRVKRADRVTLVKMQSVMPV